MIFLTQGIAVSVAPKKAKVTLPDFSESGFGAQHFLFHTTRPAARYIFCFFLKKKKKQKDAAASGRNLTYWVFNT